MEFFNLNIAGEMAQLHEKLRTLCSMIPFHGDQLFEERARNVIGTFKAGENEFDWLEGFHPEFADWHAYLI